MLEITNKNKFSLQLIVKSLEAPKAFTTLNIPAIGRGKNVYLLKDERVTEYIHKAEREGLISTRYLPNTKGE
jgi:hypothetical protein